MKYTLNGTVLRYEAAGDREWGDEIVLLHQATDITKPLSWHAPGFVIERLFDETTWKQFHTEAHELLCQCWRDSGLLVENDFALDQYHTLINDFNAHLSAIKKTTYLPVDKFPLSIQSITERISEICKANLVARNPFDGRADFHFRVIRPRLPDNNPLHRDVWLSDYDDCINLYIPIAGSNEHSSLILLPGSHLWPESRIERTVSGATINGVHFNVPAVTAIEGDFRVQRPDPLTNQVLLFSPYLIHGGSVNGNDATTRISIEMRFWKE